MKFNVDQINALKKLEETIIKNEERKEKQAIDFFFTVVYGLSEGCAYNSFDENTKKVQTFVYRDYDKTEQKQIFVNTPAFQSLMIQSGIEYGQSGNKDIYRFQIPLLNINMLRDFISNAEIENKKAK